MSHTADNARTDMAVEFVGRKPRGRLCGKVRKTQVIVDEKLSEKELCELRKMIDDKRDD